MNRQSSCSCLVPPRMSLLFLTSATWLVHSFHLLGQKSTCFSQWFTPQRLPPAQPQWRMFSILERDVERLFEREPLQSSQTRPSYFTLKHCADQLSPVFRHLLPTGDMARQSHLLSSSCFVIWMHFALDKSFWQMNVMYFDSHLTLELCQCYLDSYLACQKVCMLIWLDLQYVQVMQLSPAVW